VEYLTYLFVAVGLAMDAFAVSLSVGTGALVNNFRAKFRLAFHFGLFQMLMTIIGWLAGSTVANLINGLDHWIALVLLSYVGLNMIRSGLNQDAPGYIKDPSRGKTLLMLCVATSLDALAVGLSMAMIKTQVWIPSIIIGSVTTLLSAVGLFAGVRLGDKFGKKMEVLGGMILVMIGIQVVITHIFPSFLF
jgi:putative Mn2+ efflux pump MntP